MGFCRWLSGKESICQCRRRRRHGFDPWVRKIPWRRTWQYLIQCFCLENSMDRGVWQNGRVRRDWACMHGSSCAWNIIQTPSCGLPTLAGSGLHSSLSSYQAPLLVLRVAVSDHTPGPLHTLFPLLRTLAGESPQPLHHRDSTCRKTWTIPTPGLVSSPNWLSVNMPNTWMCSDHCLDHISRLLVTEISVIRNSKCLFKLG